MPRRERTGNYKWVAALAILVAVFLLGIGAAAGIGYLAAHGLALNSVEALIVLVGGLGGLTTLAGLAPLGMGMAAPFLILLYYPLGGLAMLVARKSQRNAPGASASRQTAGDAGDEEERKRSAS